MSPPGAPQASGYRLHGYSNLAVFARENGEGHVFGEIEPTDPADKPGSPPGPTPPPSGKPKLRVVK